MVRNSAALCAQIGRLATPQAEALGGPFEKKVQDFFREVCMRALRSSGHIRISASQTLEDCR